MYVASLARYVWCGVVLYGGDLVWVEQWCVVFDRDGQGHFCSWSVAFS